MDNIKNDAYFIKQSLNELNILIEYADEIVSYDALMSNRKNIDSIMFRLIQLIEDIKNISTKYKNEHPNIPWGDIVGFRNGIVHEYGKTDYTIVYEIIKHDIYELKDLFESTLKNK